MKNLGALLLAVLALAAIAAEPTEVRVKLDDGTERVFIPAPAPTEPQAKEPNPPTVSARPGPDNTGPTDPAGLVASGSITTTAHGQVIENKSITGGVTVKHNKVTIRNCRIDRGNASPYGVNANNGTTGLLIEDCEIKGATSAGVYGSGFTARRCNVHHHGADGFKPTRDVLIESCWVHHLGSIPDSHADGVQMVKGGNVVIRGNYFDMPHDEPGFKNSQVMIIQTNDGPIDQVEITGNWIDGGGYSVQVNDKGNGHDFPSNVTIRDNRWGRRYQFGLHKSNGGDVTDVGGNVWDGTGVLVGSGAGDTTDWGLNE